LLTFQVKKKEIKKYNDSEEKVHDTFRKS
jgi:hypothetical protein